MKRNKIFKFLSSLKLAVVLFVMFSTILAAATYYEAEYDTKTAQHLVYKSPFFAVFLAIFFINIFCSTMMRYPWRRNQVGFVLTHLGILLLLAGSAVTMGWGVDGSLMVQEGQASSRILLDDPVFFVGRTGQSMKEQKAEFRWRPPTPERPAIVPLQDGVQAEVLRYLHHARSETRYEASPKGVPALDLRIYNKRVDQRQWLTAGSGDLELGPARVRVLRASSPQHLKELLASPGAGDRGDLQLLIGGNPYQVKVSELVANVPFPLGPAGHHVELVRYLAHAVVEKDALGNDQLISKSAQPVNPCVEMRLSDTRGNQQTWLLFARFPDLNTRLGSKGSEMPVRITYAWDVPKPDGHSLTFVVAPGEQIFSKVDAQPARPVVVGKPQSTGWMDLQFEVGKFLPAAIQVMDYQVAEVKKGAEEQAPPAILVRLAGSSDPGPHWMERGDVRQVKTSTGVDLVVGYSFRSLQLGFPLMLKDFAIEYDPGTTTAASFKSTVEIDKQEHVVQMNEPLVKNGFTIFQSSYSEVPGEPTISIFTVARDPGIQLKLLGSISLVLGIAIMFWMRPYQAGPRRRAESTPNAD